MRERAKRKTQNADPAKAKLNRWLVGDGNIVGDVKNRIGGRKIRKNAVLALEFLLTASPDYFRPDHPERGGQYQEDRVIDFEKASLVWLRDTFGTENIVSVVTHLDEQTPHLHAVVVPICPDTGKLNASRWFDGKKSLSELQTRFAHAVNHLGLRRGKEHSTATHTRIGEYYGNVNTAIPPVLPDIAVAIPPMEFRGSVREQWAQTESGRLAMIQGPTLQPITDAASEQKREKARRHAAETEAARLSRALELERIRDIPLQGVFEMCGYEIDQDDKNQYRGPLGRISIETKNGKAKFYNHDMQKGGGGAIDLAMHLEGMDFPGACAFLGGSFNADAIMKAAAHKAMQDAKEAVKMPAPLPQQDESTWEKVRHYLVSVRKLAASTIDALHEKGKVFSDFRSNACFMYGADGVKLRGTTADVWHGFRGKKTGFFSMLRGRNARSVALVESAIEAMSYAELNPDASVISLSGVGGKDLAKNVRNWQSKGLKVCAAFNAGEAGDEAALRLMVAVSGVERHRPPEGNDWNDVLRAKATIEPLSTTNNQDSLSPGDEGDSRANPD
ncbi:MobV family relaxase [Methylobacter sp. G7]|uniref:MobV family relaxase n=1 Tax=Methylobacter sp. G7 TaxID=3230117 RepID=UPI003D8033D1